ncbi:hypothetical protein HYPSUDRAFT_683505 [Hypholoma sublateritium FD-334 SS-4]|uniref:Uncharacterized protein n=1 Tax=Hypholoma sublateritium (strain FD-334 SS-4) TaxID=945553 RepID=A0A0D2NZD0_HYPSF|nr:hypothetical protein HYPSUDRAFT_683505 [Hypholoma sublateritium FD-334 SS-4]
MVIGKARRKWGFFLRSFRLAGAHVGSGRPESTQWPDRLSLVHLRCAVWPAMFTIDEGCRLVTPLLPVGKAHRGVWAVGRRGQRRYGTGVCRRRWGLARAVGRHNSHER